MEKYESPYDITDKILNLTASISEKAGRLAVAPHESRPHLRRNDRIHSIYSSLKIEGNSLTIGQVQDVIDGKIVVGNRQEILEVQNAYAAYERLENIDPFDIEQLKELHGIMTQNLIAESGKFRKGEEGVFSGERCIFMASPAKFVPQLMEELFGWMISHKETVHPLIMGCVFHYEFVFIHPFADGNGRMARLWHTAILYQWQPLFAYFPLESQIEKFQEEYYAVIGACHKEGRSTRFIEFMLECIDQVLEEKAVQTVPAENKLLAVMEEGRTYTANDLMKMLGLKSRESFRRNHLNPAVKNGLIEMTDPGKPTSRNQRYHLK